jgi:hypothetical protein
MSILRDYKCDAHGYFTAWEPKCPQGCHQGINVVILKAPTMRDSVVGGRSKRNDTNLKTLAKDFGMTDIKSTREGEHQSGYLTRNNAPPEPQGPRPGDGVIWGGDNRFNMQSVMNGAIKSVKGESVGFSPKDANITRGPITASYVPDHENLKVDK